MAAVSEPRLDASLVDGQLSAFRQMTARPSPSASDPRVIPPQVFPQWAPSSWRGNGYGFRYDLTSGGTVDAAVMDQFMLWQSSRSHSPSRWPSDWGMEIGFDLYNNTITGPNRPICQQTTGQFLRYWSRAFVDTIKDEGYVLFFGGTIPASAGPYIDWLIAGDQCERNSLQLGVGEPRSLLNDTGYLFYVENIRGETSTSEFSAIVDTVSNDCNNAGQAPSTICMGLNINRPWPGPGSAEQRLVGRDRRWTVPGCALMATGWTVPTRILSGTGDPAGSGCPPAGP